MASTVEDLLRGILGASYGSTLGTTGTGGYQAPPEGTAGSTSPADGVDPRVTALSAAYQKYLQGSHQQQDPLQARMHPGLQAGAVLPGRSGLDRRAHAVALDTSQSLGGVPGAFQASHGDMQGQVGQRYNLGGGRFANVYYDKSGKRTVRVFRAA